MRNATYTMGFWSNRAGPTTGNRREDRDRERLDVGDRARRGGRQERRKEEGRGAERQDVEHHAAHDLVGPEPEAEHAVDRSDDDPAERRDREAEPRVPGELRPEDAGEGADQHHRLESDVDDARALGDELAERGEQERGAEAHGRGQQQREEALIHARCPQRGCGAAIVGPSLASTSPCPAPAIDGR